MWRRSFILLAVLCGILAGAIMALKSRRVAHSLELYLARVAHERFGVTLTMDRLEVELLPPGIAVFGVEVRRPDLDEPWFTLHRGRVLIRPWPSAAGALVVHHAELDGLKGTLDLRGQAGAVAGDDSGDLPSIDVREMLIWNTALSLRTDELDLDLQRSDFQLEPRPRGRALEITLGHAVWTPRTGPRAGVPVPFELAARAHLRGSLDRPEELTLERALLALDSVTVSATGGVSFAHGADLDVQVETQAPLAAVLPLLADGVAVGGTAECRLQLSGSPVSPRTSAQLAIRGLELDGTQLGDVDVHAVHQGERVHVESFRVSHPRAGVVTGSGSIELTGKLPITLAARTRRASLPEILDLTGTPDTWVPLDLDADLHGTGTLAPFRLNLTIDGKIARFAVLDRSFREPESEKILDIPALDIDGDFTINSWEVSLTEIHLAWGKSSGLSVSGSLGFDKTMDLKASGDMVHMAEIGPIANIRFDGHGDLAGTIEGAMDGPVVSGTIEMDAFGVEGYSLGDTKGTIIYTPDDDQLAVDRVVARRGRGTMTVSGAISFAGEQPTTTAGAELDDIDASDLLLSVGIDAELANRIHADLDGRVELTGRLALPNGAVQLAGPDLRVEGVPLGAIKATGGFGDGEELLWGTIEIDPRGRGTLEARAARRSDATITLKADASAIPIALLQPFVGDALLEGRLTGSASLRGRPNALSGRVTAVLSKLAVEGVQLETTRLQAELDHGSITVAGAALNGDARINAELRLGRQIPYNATATFQNLSLARLLDLPGGLDATMTGTLFTQGDMTHASSVIADAQLDSAELAWAGFSLHAIRPVRLQYADDSVRVDDLVFSGSGSQLSAAGTVSAARGLDLRLNGYGDLRRTGGARSPLEWLRGRVDVSTRVQGTVAEPRLSGVASLRDGALTVPGTGEVLDDIQAEVKLSGRTVTVTRGAARLGSGRVTLGGRLLLPLQGESDVTLRANLEHVSLRPEPEIHAVTSGNLSLLGPFDDLLLHGRLRIDSLRYAKNLALLDRLIPRRNAPPIKVPALNAHESVRLAVGVHAPGNVIISNNVIDTELRVDLTITGTSERVGLIGSVTPLRATAHYRDNVFVVERAAIDFSEEFRIYTQFDVRATTEACDMEIAVDVHGNSDRYNVVPRGEDENGPVEPQDVLTCLQYGQRMQKLFQHDQVVASGDTATEESPGALDNVLPIGLDLAWQVSGMDEKVRRLLPIELDEVRLESGWSSRHRRATTRVLVRKGIDERLQLRYSGSIEESDDQTLSFEYQLSDIAALEGSWLSASNVSIGDLGLDLRLRWEFR